MAGFLIGVLTTWRLASLLVNEAGPNDALAKMRDSLGVTFDEYSQCRGKHIVASALCCLWCTSVWVGWFTALMQHGFWSDWPLRGLAYSAAAILIDRERRE